MEFINKNIEDYISDHSNQETDLLSQLNRETWAKVLMPRMLSGHIQGRVLSLFSKIIKPTNIIEIGTYTGYSALCLSEGIKKDGEIHTIDINE
ncbi:MAG: methyltransferase, partial [Flavobacteriales bacterium]|nr:methyltransferase [Flavobacteriales bacterium]